MKKLTISILFVASLAAFAVTGTNKLFDAAEKMRAAYPATVEAGEQPLATFARGIIESPATGGGIQVYDKDTKALRALSGTDLFGTSGATIPGGIVAAGGYTASPRNMHTGGNPASTTADGTNTTDNTAGTVYFAEVFVPANVSVTGVAVLNGTAVAGNGKVMLYDSTGTRLAVSASTAMSGTAAYQRIAFTGAPIAVKGPATYYIGVIYDTTTHDLRSHVLGSFGAGTDAGNTYATDSTFATITVTTTFATLGPIASLY